MKYNRNEIWDLNEENVKRIFNFCRATKETPKDKILMASFITEDVPFDIPKVPLNRDNIRVMRPAINYIFGQLNFIHSRKLEMKLADGFKKYDGTDWTANKALLFSLYYLGCSSAVLSFFVLNPYSKDIVSQMLKTPNLTPTLSPNDPDFEKWCAEKNILK